MRMSPLASSMSTSACTVGPYFLARAAMNAVLEQPVQLGAVELLRCSTARETQSRISADPAIQRLLYRIPVRTRAAPRLIVGERNAMLRALRRRARRAISAPASPSTRDDLDLRPCRPRAARWSRSPGARRTDANRPRAAAAARRPATRPRARTARRPAPPPRAAPRARATRGRNRRPSPSRRRADRSGPRAPAATSSRRAGARRDRTPARQALVATTIFQRCRSCRFEPASQNKKMWGASPTFHGARRPPSVMQRT